MLEQSSDRGDIEEPAEALPVSHEGETSNTTENEEEWMDVLGSGHIMKKVVVPGLANTRPQHTDICNVRLIGRLNDENGVVVEEFDSLRFSAGEGDVIQGIDLAVQLMDVGEIANLKVGPRFAYGQLGLEPEIPSDATIFYEIELLKSSPEPELDHIPFSKRRDIATAKRERGNWWYSRQDFTKAIISYKKSLEVLDDSINYVDSEGKEVDNDDKKILLENLKDRLVVYNNLAAAHLMAKAYESALNAVDNVLKYDRQNVKALYRKGKILAAKGETQNAVDVLKEAYILEPENSTIKKELFTCQKQRQEQKKKEKKLYQKMLGQEKTPAEPVTIKSSRNESSRWGRVCGTIVTATVMVAVAATIGYRFKSVVFF